MKKIAFITVALTILFACNPNKKSNLELQLRKHLRNQEYFALRRLTDKHKHEIGEELLLEIEAYLLNTFNKTEASNSKINYLLSNYKVSDSLKTELLLIKTDNYLKLFNYKKAYKTSNYLLNELNPLLDSTQRADLKNMNNIYFPLLNILPQQVKIESDNYIPLIRDAAGLMNVSVTINGCNYPFIFDTGAGMPIIKKSFANNLGIQMLETNIDVNSATGKVVNSSLAVIDSLKIGEILVENSVFLVVEDAMLEFPKHNYFPVAAIGFPIIKELKEFSILKSETLIVPKKPTSSALANMGLYGLTPHVYLYNGTDTLEYAFDTGAAKSHFTYKYYQNYKSLIEQNYKPNTVTTASAGGAKKHKSYLMDSSILFIGTQKAPLVNTHIHTQKNKTFEDVYGNLGQDLIRQFDKMTLNFNDMYLKFE